MEGKPNPRAPLDIDREAVKTLAVAVGVREAARQMGLPESTVQSWSARGKWFAHLIRAEPPASMKPVATIATKPAQAMQNIMAGRKEKSRFHLSQFVLNASKVASKSRSPLRDAQNVRHVAAVHSAIWPEQQVAPGVTLNVLNVAGGME